MSDKEFAIQTISQLPDDITMDEIARRIEFLTALQKGLDQVKAGHTVPHDEVKRQLATWLSK